MEPPGAFVDAVIARTKLERRGLAAIRFFRQAEEVSKATGVSFGAIVGAQYEGMCIMDRAILELYPPGRGRAEARAFVLEYLSNGVLPGLT